MVERDRRSESLKQRLNRDKEKIDKTSKTEETEKNVPREEAVKNRPSVLMYLPEELHRELDIRFDELNAQYKREHGEGLQKNRDYYPAIVKAALEGKDVKDILDI